jgi:predicted ATPase
VGIAPIGQVHAALAGVIFATPIHLALTTTFIAANTDALDAVAEHLKQVAASERIFLFHGEMGAGKTTLIKAMCQKLGVKDEMSSPTFSLVNEYESLLLDLCIISTCIASSERKSFSTLAMRSTSTVGIFAL